VMLSLVTLIGGARVDGVDALDRGTRCTVVALWDDCRGCGLLNIFRPAAD